MIALLLLQGVLALSLSLFFPQAAKWGKHQFAEQEGAFLRTFHRTLMKIS